MRRSRQAVLEQVLKPWRSYRFSTKNYRPVYRLRIIFIVVSLVFISSVVIFQIDSNLIVRHISAIVLGLILMFLVYKIPLKSFLRYSSLVLVLGLVLGVLAFNDRWLLVGSLSIQPIEIVKLGFILVSAGLLSSLKYRRRVGLKGLLLQPSFYIPAGIIFLIALLFLFVQGDFGSVTVIAGVFLAMLLVSGIKLRHFAAIVAVIIVSFLLVIVMSNYRSNRFTAYFDYLSNPSSLSVEYCQNEGYQLCQALIGVGSGGLTGRGFGKSVQSKGYLPETRNDSIFVIVAEVAGLIGAIIVLGLLSWLLAIIYKIARYSEKGFMLIAIGIMVWLSLQAFINVGGVIGLIPIKGITLPYVSYGGSSIVLVLLATGIILNIAKYIPYEALKK